MRNLIPLARFFLRLFAATLFASSVNGLYAQLNLGSIEGRILNPATGEYLEHARVAVEGTSVETFTDAAGVYRLANLPAGTARLRIFYTGFTEQRAEVAVVAGQSVQREISLTERSAEATPRRGEIVKLSEFVVGASREMSAAAIAINEQRFAPNIRQVVSTEEFGTVAEGNAAEFLKFVPGITVNYVGGTARGISVEGTPTDNVPVTMNGFSIATASSATSRETVADMVSINNLSRIEVAYSPTPETPGSALAGSINMVPRSAFERQRPLFTYSGYLMMRSDFHDFRRTPGPRHEYTYKPLPGFDISYVAPVNKNFGFTVSAGHSSQYSDESDTITTWRGGGGGGGGEGGRHTPP
jgi:iron complex outermembrane recepter protein